MNDFAQIVSGLGDAARAIGAEVASVWVLIQLALLLLAAAAAAVIGALVRKRVDLVALTMGWPSFLRPTIRANGDAKPRPRSTDSTCVTALAGREAPSFPTTIMLAP